MRFREGLEGGVIKGPLSHELDIGRHRLFVAWNGGTSGRKKCGKTGWLAGRVEGKIPEEAGDDNLRNQQRLFTSSNILVADMMKLGFWPKLVMIAAMRRHRCAGNGGKVNSAKLSRHLTGHDTLSLTPLEQIRWESEYGNNQEGVRLQQLDAESTKMG